LALLTRAKKGPPAATPNKFAYTAAISACSRAGQWRPALKLLDEMEMMGIQPDVVAFNAVLYSCRLGAQWRCALETLRRFEVGGWVGG
jgi:pentatricopeptide repeat domain-containing protein 1